MKVCHTEHMADGQMRHPWEDWVWDETVFEGTAGYYRQGRKPYAPALADALAEHLHLDGRGRLLDVGCGPGTVALLFAHLFEDVIGLDPDSGMLAEAQRTAAEERIINASWVQMRAEDLPGPPSAPSESSASANLSTGWTDPELRLPSARCSMPMVPSFKSTFGTPARRTRCLRAGHTHQYPRHPSIICVAVGSVLTAVQVKGSGTPRPMGRTRCSGLPGSRPKNS